LCSVRIGAASGILLVLALAAACGSSRPHVTVEGPLGQGADQVWVFEPSGPPKDVVVFIHGLGNGELTPANHRPWLEHLAKAGSAVFYPRYEASLGQPDAVLHVLAAVRTGLKRLHRPGLPLVAIGYSRGGEIVIDYAAVARGAGPAPRAVLSVFPGTVDPVDPPLDLRSIDKRTRLTILVGDRDTVVDGAGARQMLSRLAAARFPGEQISLVVVKSRGSFVVTHLAPLEVSPAARAAFWIRADRIIERARGGG
jgi:pimeloyl-ACP methyl ester carboxylesterase